MIGAGPAIFKVIKTVEFLKSVLADVHISVDLAEMQCEFVYEPLFENLKEVREIKGKAAIKATFSFVESKVSSLPGYQKIEHKVDPIKTGKFLEKARHYVTETK